MRAPGSHGATPKSCHAASERRSSSHECGTAACHTLAAAGTDTLSTPGVQWGTMDYHRQTLDNVAEASRRTRKLCAVMLDTLGREIVVRRNATIGPDGWPVHEETMKVVSGQKVGRRSQLGELLAGADIELTSPEAAKRWTQWHQRAHHGGLHG
jgi:Pyruvate kinase, barrel domain